MTETIVLCFGQMNIRKRWDDELPDSRNDYRDSVCSSYGNIICIERCELYGGSYIVFNGVYLYYYSI